MSFRRDCMHVWFPQQDVLDPVDRDIRTILGIKENVVASTNRPNVGPDRHHQSPLQTPTGDC